jgi:hypothetical protein
MSHFPCPDILLQEAAEWACLRQPLELRHINSLLSLYTSPTIRQGLTAALHRLDDDDDNDDAC